MTFEQLGDGPRADGGLAEVRAYLEELWDRALAELEAAAERKREEEA